ncbi:hypothetical protein ALC62_02031 [Cyphomyrmex costatus]|uniref:Uncharacterized protein n=1 Tax=Cyphomyrmex costatus TaxID=456900 RepID=A0A151INI3_9HYME|nr:hypothetical protein ALC62_02031 [Cyphomyrmex costatus]
MASLNNILRQCKERLLGHYRRWLTILAIWLGQCHVSGPDSPACSPPISPFFPTGLNLDSLPSFCPFLCLLEKVCIVRDTILD